MSKTVLITRVTSGMGQAVVRVQRPPHLNINHLELMPVSQSFTGFQIVREG